MASWDHEDLKQRGNKQQEEPARFVDDLRRMTAEALRSAEEEEVGQLITEIQSKARQAAQKGLRDIRVCLQWTDFHSDWRDYVHNLTVDNLNGPSRTAAQWCVEQGLATKPVYLKRCTAEDDDAWYLVVSW